MPFRSQTPAPTYPKTAPGPRPRIGFAIAAIEHIFSVQLQLCRATVELPRQSALPDLWRTTIWRGQRLMTPCSKRVGSTHPKSTTNEQHANAKLAGYCVAGHRCNYKATTATMLQNKKRNNVSTSCESTDITNRAKRNRRRPCRTRLLEAACHCFRSGGFA